MRDRGRSCDRLKRFIHFLWFGMRMVLNLLPNCESVMSSSKRSIGNLRNAHLFGVSWQLGARAVFTLTERVETFGLKSRNAFFLLLLLQLSVTFLFKSPSRKRRAGQKGQKYI